MALAFQVEPGGTRTIEFEVSEKAKCALCGESIVLVDTNGAVWLHAERTLGKLYNHPASPTLHAAPSPIRLNLRHRCEEPGCRKIVTIHPSTNRSCELHSRLKQRAEAREHRLERKQAKLSAVDQNRHMEPAPNAGEIVQNAQPAPVLPSPDFGVQIGHFDG
jgi:hypothetical protein